MKVAVLGLGRIGLPTALNIARFGAGTDTEVVGYDPDPVCYELLRDRRAPFNEPLLESTLESTTNFSVVRDVQQALADAIAVVVCVPTDQMHHVAATLRQLATPNCTIIVRTTQMMGGTANFVAQLPETMSVVYLPEFREQGKALINGPSSVWMVAGVKDKAKELPFVGYLWGVRDTDVQCMSYASAEIVKLKINEMLAIRVAFANSVADLCRSEADANDVLQAIRRDSRIGSSHLKPGLGFGGPCLDLALQALQSPLGRVAQQENRDQVDRCAALVAAAVREKRGNGKVLVGVYGLAFKPFTDDCRQSQAVELVKRLAGRAAMIELHAVDPELSGVTAHARLAGLPATVHGRVGDFLQQPLDVVVLSHSRTNYQTTFHLTQQLIAAYRGRNVIVIDLQHVLPLTSRQQLTAERVSVWRLGCPTDRRNTNGGV